MVDQRMDLRRQAAAGTPDAVVDRFVVQALELGVYRPGAAGE